MGNYDKLKTKKYIKSADNVKVGIDYLRLNFQEGLPQLDAILKMLNTTNSNFHIQDGLTYTKKIFNTGPCLLISTEYNGLVIPIMFYGKVGLNLQTKLTSRLDFYGSFFRLQEVLEIPESFIPDFLAEHSTEDPGITRLDYCIDLFFKKYQNIWKPDRLMPNRRKGTKVNEISDVYGHQSWAVGQKSTKRLFFRVYNKLLDTSKKGKMFYYGDYFNYKTVTRLELQCGPSYTRGYQYSRLANLLIKCQHTLKVHDAFDGVMFYKYSTEHDINERNKLMITRQYVGKAKKFVNAGINPYTTLYTGLKTSEYIDNDTHHQYIAELQNHILLTAKKPDV